jgi:hypothetical protein
VPWASKLVLRHRWLPHCFTFLLFSSSVLPPSLCFSQAPSDPGTARGRVVSTTRNPHRTGEQLQSATSILLTRELNYGMGPSKHNYSFNYTMKSIRYKLIATPAVTGSQI